MKNIRKLIAVLLLLSSIFVFAGCESTHDEEEQSVLEISLSYTMKKRIDDAYNARYERLYNYNPQYAFCDHWSDPKNGMLGGLRYYGTYERYIVFFLEGNADAVEHYEIAGYYFMHPQAGTIFVYDRKADCLYTIREAYAEGVISDKAVAMAIGRHNEYNVAVYGEDWWDSLDKMHKQWLAHQP